MQGNKEYILWYGMGDVAVSQMCHPDSPSGKNVLPSCGQAVSVEHPASSDISVSFSYRVQPFHPRSRPPQVTCIQ